MVVFVVHVNDVVVGTAFGVVGALFLMLVLFCFVVAVVDEVVLLVLVLVVLMYIGRTAVTLKLPTVTFK